MKSVNTGRNWLLLLAVALWLVPVARGQGQPSAAPPAAPAQGKAKAKVARPAAAKKPATATKKPAAAAKKPAAASKKPAAEKKAEVAKKAEVKSAAAESKRRDPFLALIGREHSGSGLAEHLPPGKAGLMVSTLRIEGLVHGPNGMIAVVSNPQERVYFLRPSDQLYDGQVEKITLDDVTFQERSKDAFGRPLERTVIKRLYPIAGEQR